MAEIKKFPNQSRYEELAIMEKEEFDKEIEKYEDHPKLKDLIEKYRETSSEGYANLCGNMPIIYSTGTADRIMWWGGIS